MSFRGGLFGRQAKAGSEKPIENIRVTLKPILGLSPRVYLPIFWSLIIAAFVFFLLVFPGIRKNGTLLTVLTRPLGASILIDGKRLGSSNDEVFVPRGRRVLTVRKSGFVTKELELEMRGRIFASKLLPRRERIEVILTPKDTKTLLSDGMKEFIAWTATGPDREGFPIPPTLTRSARDLAHVLDSEEAEAFLTAALPAAVDSRHLADALRAQALFLTKGAPPGLGTLLAMVSGLTKTRLEGLLPLMTSAEIESLGLQSLEEAEAAEIRELLETPSMKPASVDLRSHGGILFSFLPAGALIVGDRAMAARGYKPRFGARPRRLVMDSYGIMTEELTWERWLLFIASEPQWADAVHEAGSDSPSMPLTGVSWEGAMAYAAWFSERYLEGTGLTARLPTEDEWEYAARLNGIQESHEMNAEPLRRASSLPAGSMGLRGMSGNVREWCLNPYRLNEAWYAGPDGRIPFQEADNPFSAPERAVRGGAHIDRGAAVPTVLLRGGLPPSWTSPVLGFRLVLVPQNSG